MAAREHAALRLEEDPAVGREAAHDVGSRVPGESIGRPAGHRHDVHVDVAVVVAAERDQLPVGRAGGPGFHSGGRRESPRAAAVAARDPQVRVVDESEVARADRRLREHARVLGVDRVRNAGK